MLSKKIGIDLGTSTVLVYVKGEGVVVNEPAVMALDEKGARVLAVGRAASDMSGRGKARVVRPVRNGDGVDYGAAGALVQHLIGRVVGRQRLFRPDVMLSIQPMVTGVERRAVLEATMQAGAKSAYLIDKPMAAAIGARVSVATTDGVLIVNLGAGSTEIAAIAHGEMLALESTRAGGTALTAAIEQYVASAHGLELAPGQAEQVKLELGSAAPLPSESTMDVIGKSSDGLDATVQLSSEEVRAAMERPLAAIVSAIKRVMTQVPGDSRTSISRNGAILTGGVAQLRGMAEFLGNQLEMPVRVARDPQSCVAVGTGMALDNLQVIRRGQHYIT